MQLKKIATGLVAGAATTTALLAGTVSAAHAATTYTPTGSSVNFVGSGVSFTDPLAEQTLTCAKFDLAGSVTNSGTSRAYGVEGGSLTSLSSSGCTNPVAGPTTVTPTGAWGVTVTGDPTGTSFPAQLTNVAATVSAVGCTFNVGGTLNGTFDNGTQKFTPGTSGLSIVNAPAGATCLLLGVEQGDPITVSGSWTNAGAALTIANP